RGGNTVAVPVLRSCKACMFIATILPRLLRIGAMPAIQRYSSMTAAYGAAYGQLFYYQGMVQEGHLRWIKDAAILDKHVHEWKADENSAMLPLGFILS